MEIGFRHGAMCESYEEQAKKQGYTLGDKADLFDKVGFSYNMLRLHGYITDSQSNMICKKIQKELVANIKPVN